MTIEVYGHVEKMESAATGYVRLTLSMETRAQPITVDATLAEIGTMYLPGTSVKVQITPIPSRTGKEKNDA